ncbi:hypothetical protein CVT24_004799 [Panaeolus cyanescens]|uniref:Uncharacterized protein n=1 Tax=Panaeolus cyanescens TaxID=181874 RepID=A0A409VQ68_9AGAR|nr:hypothetical protein CVT24_004799 [Panaeolus cyanescens]
MSSNTNTNNPYRSAMGSGMSGGAGDYAGSRDNTHDGYGGSNTFTNNRGVDTTDSESYGRSTGTDPRMTQSGMGTTGTTHSHLRSDQINATTDRPYGEPTGSGYYDPSRVNPSASSATGGMPGTDSELRSATAATGHNSGRGIHADQFYSQGMGSGMPTSTSTAGMGTTTGHHGHQSEGHHGHHHEHATDKEHCTMCHMVDERARQMGSMGQTSAATTGAGMPASGMGRPSGTSTGMGTGMPSSASQTAGMKDVHTETHEGPSKLHLRPGETVVEQETRVHRGVAPGEKSSSHTSGMGMSDASRAGMGTGAMGGTAAGMGHGTGMGAGTGMSSGLAGAGTGMSSGMTGTGAGMPGGMAGTGSAATKNVSMTDKVMGEAKKVAGKVTSNEEMMREGEERMTGTTAMHKN